MKIRMMICVLALISAGMALGQPGNDKPVSVIEYLYILPKPGMSEKLQAALKAHDQKFHPEGLYVGTLHKVDFGEKAGWFVFVMGPTSYEAFDKPPDIELAHYSDWNKNVMPLVAEFGGMGLWNYTPELSYGLDILKKSPHYELWGVIVKRGEYKRFRALTEKLKQTYESMKSSSFLVFENPVHTPGSADFAYVWSFPTYSDWSKDDGTKAAYEKIFGAGSWDQLITEWDQVTEDHNAELRTVIR